MIQEDTPYLDFESLDESKAYYCTEKLSDDNVTATTRSAWWHPADQQKSNKNLSSTETRVQGQNPTDA